MIYHLELQFQNIDILKEGFHPSYEFRLSQSINSNDKKNKLFKHVVIYTIFDSCD